MSNTERIISSLRRDRPMTSVTLRMPEDVLEDLKRIAPVLGHSGYQPLIRAYVGRGLRADLEKLEGSEVAALVANLRRRGVDESVLAKALAEVTGGSA
jgi:hypothetical protein